MKIINPVTTQVSIPKQWLLGDWEDDIKIKVKADVWNYEGKHTVVLREITCTGYQMWLVNQTYYFDIVSLIDKQVIDEYANMKLNAAESNLSDYVE
jgi:hypothetical protein